MISTQDIVLRLFVAAVLGSVVGLQREWKDRSAGLRTHALISLGSALIVLVSAYGFMDVLQMEHIRLAPSRMAAQVVSGVEFLAVGIIIFRRDAVRGLSTAASIWVVAAIGLAAGTGLFVVAFVGVALDLIVLAGLDPLERRFFTQHRPRSLSVTMRRNKAALSSVEAVLRSAGMDLDFMRIRPEAGSDEDRMEVFFKRVQSDRLVSVTERLREIQGVRRIEMLPG